MHNLYFGQVNNLVIIGCNKLIAVISECHRRYKCLAAVATVLKVEANIIPFAGL